MNQISDNRDEHEAELEVLWLKGNVIPRGFVQLEELFDFSHVAQNTKMQPIGTRVEDCNIGTKENPMIVNLSNSLT